MKKMTRLVLTLMVIFSVAMSAPTTNVFAEDGNVIYSGNSGNFIFEPGSEYSPTDLFPNFKDVMPGDTLSQKIVVKNNATKSVKISMRALGAHEDSVDFLSQLNLYVEKVTDTPLFEAPADQTAQLTEWREIGVLAAGGEAELEVCLQVPVTLDNENQSLIGYLDWEFMVEEIDDGTTQTGDSVNYLPWFIGLGCSVVAIVIVVIVNRRKDENDKKNQIDETEETAKGGTAE